MILSRMNSSTTSMPLGNAQEAEIATILWAVVLESMGIVSTLPKIVAMLGTVIILEVKSARM